MSSIAEKHVFRTIWRVGFGTYLFSRPILTHARYSNQIRGTLSTLVAALDCLGTRLAAGSFVLSHLQSLYLSLVGKMLQDRNPYHL